MVFSFRHHWTARTTAHVVCFYSVHRGRVLKSLLSHGGVSPTLPCGGGGGLLTRHNGPAGERRFLALTVVNCSSALLLL